MTAAMKRDHLISYLAEADDNKIKALYTVLEKEIKESEIAPVFTQEQIAILEERRLSFLNGTEQGIDWQTMHDNIRNKRKSA
jgi:hypothetical protein